MQLKPKFWWNTYLKMVKLIWTTQSWYIFVFAIILMCDIHHPVRAFLALAFLGCFFFPLLAMAMGYLEHKRRPSRE